MVSPLVGAPLGRLVPFGSANASAVLTRLSAIPKLAGVTPASKIEVPPAPEMASSGIREMDALCGGLPRGCLSEIYGPASSGRTSMLLAVLAAATRRQEVCALVDATDAFDPLSGVAAGLDFSRLLWVRCGGCLPRRHQGTEKAKDTRNENPLEQALRVTDLLLQSGGFGLVAIDLGDVSMQAARRIPLTSWFRFRRAVENTATVLFVAGQASYARTCASLVVRLGAQSTLSAVSSQLSVNAKLVDISGIAKLQEPAGIKPVHAKLNSAVSEIFAQEIPSHAQLLDELRIEAEFLRLRTERKPMQSVTAFATKTVRAG